MSSESITIENSKLIVRNNPIMPFIERDGIGIAPGVNINYNTGYSIFEATHGTAPKLAGKNMVNPSSIILSGAMMFEYMGWTEVAELIETAVEAAIASKRVTFDFHRLMENAELLSTSEFGDEIIRNM